MRITKLCILCSVSKVLGPLAKGSLSISALLPSNTLGNPKDTQGNSSSTASVKGASGAGAKEHQISGDQIYSTNILLLLL